MKKQILFLTAYIIGALTLSAQEGEVINHIFDGNQQAESNEFNGAEMAYRRALSKAPEKPEALYNLGNTHFKEQDFDEAKQRYFQTQKFTENKFSKQQAFHNLGNVFMKQKDYANAVEAYKNGLRNNPQDEETRYNYALAKELLKKEQDQDQDQQDQQDQKNEDEQENKDQDQDQKNEGDKDKDSGQENDEEQGEEGDKDELKKEEGGQKKENQPQQGDQEKEQLAQPKKTELSPEQVKSLLEAMSNQEKKVQDKVNAEKVQGIPIRGQKDW